MTLNLTEGIHFVGKSLLKLPHHSPNPRSIPPVLVTFVTPACLWHAFLLSTASLIVVGVCVPVGIDEYAEQKQNHDREEGWRKQEQAVQSAGVAWRVGDVCIIHASIPLHIFGELTAPLSSETHLLR